MVDWQQKLPSGEFVILREKSPRGEHGHVVVSVIEFGGFTVMPVHDPHPESTMLDGFDEKGMVYDY